MIGYLEKQNCRAWNDTNLKRLSEVVILIFKNNVVLIKSNTLLSGQNYDDGSFPLIGDFTANENIHRYDRHFEYIQ